MESKASLSMFKNLLEQPKSRKVAIALALTSAVTPVSGFHKFYLGQPVWGTLYVLLSVTQVPRIASAFEAVWFALQAQEKFEQRFNGLEPEQISSFKPQEVEAIAQALRHLDDLRAEGLLTEQEFEQKRRQLLDKIS
ncbi:MAG: SHOCT domain-containing protein [Cyanobacteria bacterium P01_H01_bin.15]